MADFGEIQRKFDSDPELCKRFLTDPVGVLAEQGVTLAPQQAFGLQQDILNFTKSPVTIEALHISIHAPRVSISVGGGGGVGVSVSGGISID